MGGHTLVLSRVLGCSDKQMDTLFLLPLQGDGRSLPAARAVRAVRAGHISVQAQCTVHLSAWHLHTGAQGPSCEDIGQAPFC